MSKGPLEGDVVSFQPRESDLMATIRELAKDTSKVSFGRHCLERMDERSITTLDALRVLRTGDIEGGIEAGKHHGEWKCKVIAAIRGNREIGVVTVVIHERRLKIKTVEWED